MNCCGREPLHMDAEVVNAPDGFCCRHGEEADCIHISDYGRWWDACCGCGGFR